MTTTPTPTPFEHTCEVCEKTEILTPDEAFNQGWDYPPMMGAWGVLSPRTCGDCAMIDTAWFALVANGTAFEDLTDRQKAMVLRVASENKEDAL